MKHFFVQKEYIRNWNKFNSVIGSSHLKKSKTQLFFPKLGEENKQIKKKTCFYKTMRYILFLEHFLLKGYTSFEVIKLYSHKWLYEIFRIIVDINNRSIHTMYQKIFSYVSHLFIFTAFFSQNQLNHVMFIKRAHFESRLTYFHRVWLKYDFIEISILCLNSI